MESKAKFAVGDKVCVLSRSHHLTREIMDAGAICEVFHVSPTPAICAGPYSGPEIWCRTPGPEPGKPWEWWHVADFWIQEDEIQKA